MSKIYVENTLKLILTKEELNRITILSKDGKIQVIVDMHQLGAGQAKKLLNNLIVMLRGEFELKVIHGYNHGTVIKEIIWNEYQNHKIKTRKADKNNQGVTYLGIA